MESARDDFLPSARWENLVARADLLRRLREFFHDCGFMEVETPVLSADTVVDRHIDPYSLTLSGSGGGKILLWMQTSPEFAMKRLLAAGATAIYQVSRVFRQGEKGPLHNPEFTLVEWYRVGDELADGMALTGELCEELLERGPAEQMTYAEAFERYVGLNPLTASTAALIDAARHCPAPPPESMSPADRDGWLDWLLTEEVQQHLGRERPLLLYDFPASQAALAQVVAPVRPDEPPVARRFELYVDGLEVANGYQELLDAAELRRRNAATNAQREADGTFPLPEASRLLAAMEAGLPPATGVALGFDRLVMIALGAKAIDEVIAFPIDRA